MGGGELVWYVYILRCGDGSLYTGITLDLQRRLRAHSSGRGARYTRSHLPVELVYYEPASDRSAALRREAAIKALPRMEKLRLMEKGAREMIKMQRADRQLSQEEALEVVDRCEYAFLAMTGEDGNPYCLPLSTVRDGLDVYFHCAMEGYKTACMRRAPKVCLTCVEGARHQPEKMTMIYGSAVALGVAEEVTDEKTKEKALRLLCRRHAAGVDAQKVEKCVMGGLQKTAVWCIHIHEITGKANRG